MTRVAATTLPSQRAHVKGERWVAQGPREWLTEKGERDRSLHLQQTKDGGDLQRLWIVHGKIYDLSAYMDKHPGGALKWRRGMRVSSLLFSLC
jgi:predicted ABC-type transport system involved in lysophospholipase L1 biosynthesis ATPase subunit